MNTQLEQPDEMTLRLAEMAFNSGMPMEQWAAMVCNAYNIDHNLPTTDKELTEAILNDIAETRDALNRAFGAK